MAPLVPDPIRTLPSLDMHFVLQLDKDTPINVSLLVNVGVMKADGNFIPVSSAEKEHLNRESLSLSLQ